MTPEQLLAGATRRIRWVLAQRSVVRWAWIAAATSVAIVVLARYVSWGPTEVVGLVAPLAAVVAVAFVAARRTLTPPVVARVADVHLSSHDALGAYLQFRGTEGPFTSRIERRAHDVAAASKPTEAVPASLVGERRDVRRRLGGALALASLALGLAFVGNPQDAARERAAREHAAIEAARRDLKAEADRLGADTETGKELDKLQRELAGMNAADATKRLAELEADMAAKAGERLDSAQAANAGLNSALGARPLPGANASSDAAAQLAEAAKALESMTPEERAELAKRLADLAATQSAGAPDVASALQSAAAQVADGSSEAAAAVQAASAAQAAQAASVASRGRASAAAAAAGAARRSVDAAKSGSGNGRGAGQGAGKGQGSSPGKGQGSGQGKGQGKGSGQGSGQGQGQGAGQGQGSGAGGSPSGNVGAGQRNGSGAGQGGAGRPGNNGAGLGGSSNEQAAPASQVYAPDPRGARGEGPQQGEGGDLGSQTGTGSAPSTRGAATLPLSDAVATYRDQATQAMNDPQIPASSRSLMSDYFQQLTAASGQKG